MKMTLRNEKEGMTGCSRALYAAKGLYIEMSEDVNEAAVSSSSSSSFVFCCLSALWSSSVRGRAWELFGPQQTRVLGLYSRCSRSNRPNWLPGLLSGRRLN